MNESKIKVALKDFRDYISSNLHKVRFKVTHYDESCKMKTGRKFASDLYISYALVIGSTEDGVSSIILGNEHQDKEEWLFKTAYANMEAQFSKNTLSGEIMSLGFESDIVPDVPKAVIFTNQDRMNGACQMLNKVELSKLSDEWESDLIIIPSSIHEVIILPKFFAADINYVNQMIRGVNEREVLPNEVLSDHAYAFVRSTREIMIPLI